MVPPLVTLRRPPPAPLTFDVIYGCPLTLNNTFVFKTVKSLATQQVVNKDRPIDVWSQFHTSSCQKIGTIIRKVLPSTHTAYLCEPMSHERSQTSPHACHQSYSTRRPCEIWLLTTKRHPQNSINGVKRTVSKHFTASRPTFFLFFLFLHL